jgi:hypothetical protein
LKRLIFSLCGQGFRKNGNESDGQGSFRKKPSQKVWDSKGDKKSIRGKAGAEIAGNDHITQKSENTAQQRRRTNNAGRLGNTGIFPHHSKLSFPDRFLTTGKKLFDK